MYDKMVSISIYNAECLGVPSNTYYPNEKTISNEDYLKQANNYDMVFSQHKDNQRKKENFIQSNCLFFDIDEYCSIDQFKEEWKEVQYYLFTSRNHNKPKQVRKEIITCDRFHGLFPIPYFIEDRELYEGYLKSLVEYYPYFDKAVCDSSRFFFGNPNTKVFSNLGNENIIEHLDRLPKVIDKYKALNIGIIEKELLSGHNAILITATRLIGKGKELDEVLAFTLYDNATRFETKIDETFVRKEVERIYNSYHEENKHIIIKNYRNERVKEITVFEIEPKFKKIPYNNFLDGTYNQYPLKYLSSFGGNDVSMLFDTQNPENYIPSFASLTANLGKYNVGFDFADSTLGKSEYMAFLEHNAKKYNRFSLIPEMEYDLNTYYFPNDIKPKNNGTFKEYLDTFTFDKPNFIYRYALSILTMFSPSHIKAIDKPAFLFLADKSSSGKTYTAEHAVRMAQIDAPIFFSWKETNEKKINSVRSIASKAIIYDNIKGLNNEQRANIEQTTNIISLDTWFFGKAHTQTDNNKTFFLTFNSDTDISADILNRVVSVKLPNWEVLYREEKERTEVRNNIVSKMLEWESKREEVIADLLFAFENAPMPTNEEIEKKIKVHSRYIKWSKYMARFLFYFFPEIESFDLDKQYEENILNQEGNLWRDFFLTVLTRECAGKSKGFVLTKDLLKVYIAEYGDKERFTNSERLFSLELPKIKGKVIDISVKYIQKRINGKQLKGWEVENMVIEDNPYIPKGETKADRMDDTIQYIKDKIDKEQTFEEKCAAIETIDDFVGLALNIQD